MPVTTHCLVNDPVGTGELRANTAFPGGIAPLVPTGSKRGVVVLLHHLNNGGGGVPFPLEDYATPVLYQTLANDLVADGWVVVFPVELGDTFGVGGGQTAGLNADFANDAGLGSRLLRNTGNWWDGGLAYILAEFGNWPVVPFGVSWGGWCSLAVATTRPSTITAYGAHVAAMIPWTISGSLIITPPGGTIYTLAPSMAGLTLPQSSITVNESLSGAPAGPNSICVQTSGGIFAITYAAVNTGTKTFTGCTGGIASFGTMASGGDVASSTGTNGANISYTALNALANGQLGSAPLGFVGWETGDNVVGFSNQQLLYNNAQAAGAPVTSYAVSGGGHEMSAADVTAIMAWFTGSVDPLCPAVH